MALYSCEMGTGKTLAALEVCERLLKEGILSDPRSIWYIGPKTGVSAVRREMRKWSFDTLDPVMFTYQGLVNHLQKIPAGYAAPQIVIFDESSHLMNPQSQRSQVAMIISNAIVAEHGKKGFMVLMSGSPAPKSPMNWWHQCELCQPGFLAEANMFKFKARMGIYEARENATGGAYNHLISWWSDEGLCSECGYTEDNNGDHCNMRFNKVTMQEEMNPSYHAFKPSINEVSKLYGRMKGLVLVKFKKDCLDLPEIQYRIIRVKPNVDTIKTAKLIVKTTPRTVTALMHLRELSDGFLYTEELDGTSICPNCHGTGEETVYINDSPDVNPTYQDPDQYEAVQEECCLCLGTKVVPKYKRGIETIDCPKLDVITDLLVDNEQYGRLIIWAGFSGSIDRLVQHCLDKGWNVLRYDKNVQALTPLGTAADPEVFLDAMDASHPDREKLLAAYPNLVFIGNPGAGGMGLTLTSACMMVYYSNTFNGVDRIQSIARFHRPGADENRGCTVVDIFHLQTDEKVLENINLKKRLQSMTLGEVTEALNQKVEEEYYGQETSGSAVK